MKKTLAFYDIPHHFGVRILALYRYEVVNIIVIEFKVNMITKLVLNKYMYIYIIFKANGIECY